MTFSTTFSRSNVTVFGILSQRLSRKDSFRKKILEYSFHFGNHYLPLYLISEKKTSVDMRNYVGLSKEDLNENYSNLKITFLLHKAF